MTEKKYPLTQKEAEIRKQLVTDSTNSYSINYDLLLTLNREKEKTETDKGNYQGYLKLSFTYHPKKELDSENLFLNFFGSIISLKINDTVIQNINFENHKIILNEENLIPDKTNFLEILFYNDYNHNGVGLHHYTDSSDNKCYLFTDFEPFNCHRLFPCFDQPDIKATLNLSVIAPKEYIVIANESEIINDMKNISKKEDLKNIKFNLNDESLNFITNNNKIFNNNYNYHNFNKTPKISSYLYCVCAGEYVSINCENKNAQVPMKIYLRESIKNYKYANFEEIFNTVIEGIKYYEKLFKIKFPFSKYDQIFCPEYNNGAMENVGLVTFLESYIFKTEPTNKAKLKRLETILHELSHMWFGDFVTMKWWDNLWLNESFAVFISNLCLNDCEYFVKNYKTDFNNIGWLSFNSRKSRAITLDQQSITHPVYTIVDNTEVAEANFDTITYGKGSSILKQMYYYIGHDNFCKGVNKYFEKYGWGNTVFDNFVDEMKNIVGDEIKVLFDDWLKKAGINEISLNIELDGEIIKKFDVVQKCQIEGNYQCHFVDILFVYDFEKKEENKIFKKIKIEKQEITHLLNFENLKNPKIIFMNYLDWGYFKINLDKNSINNLKEGLKYFNDSLTKQQIYRSLFDQTRDAKVSSAEILDILLDIVNYEKDESIISTLLSYIHSIINSYVPLEFRIKTKGIFFDVLTKLLKNINNMENVDIDIFKNIYSYLGINAVNENNYEVLLKLIDTKPTIYDTEIKNPKLISINTKFSYCKKLYNSTKLDNETKNNILNKLIEEDKNSQKSVLTKLTCEALNPDIKNKEKLWDIFINAPKNISLYNIDAMMEGFAPLCQIELIQNFINEKFFEDISKIYKKTERRYVRSFIHYLSPKINNENIINKFEKILEEVKDIPAAKRIITEKIDNLKRELKCNEKFREYVEKNKEKLSILKY